ncbi:CAP domain-containing protein [Polaromonas sp. CG_9.11]|uniref:CAP domain-containing protein n=1 Tax=Polaromonas sp. CG_9.11 TaxID=2787730 RepID=UPI0018CB53ED|nr:CAP domain-containing protein [Polaromonas sp. CG_9.11]MBG6075465.1 uncharacterized protein YkwD [Polaromonas sp. CG_9.11]
MPLKPGFIRCACQTACVATLVANTAFAQEDGELVGLINAYRNAPQTCEGRQTAATGPLAPSPALSGVQGASGGPLNDELKARGYQAAQVQTITVSGPASASAVMKLITQRFCRPLLSTRYAEIGISRDAATWRIVLARPLLSPDLDEWREAGREVLRLANMARAKPRTCGDQPFSPAPLVTWNAQIAAAAHVHSRDMANRNYFRHSGKDGGQVGDRAGREGYAWQRVGENIAAGQGSPQQVMSAWLSSPHHCANIMDPHFTEMGAAYAVNPESDGVIYWTQVFGTPR